MATASDLDTKALVRKYLERPAVLSKEDESADQADEVEAILESVAITFLLYPQAALSIVQRSKNTLQQVVSKYIQIIDYIISSASDVGNPDEAITDSSDIIEAQTALLELDRLGKVEVGLRAYGRYSSAVNRFLNNRLAKPLKRKSTQTFERSGTEAKQDILSTYSVLVPIHTIVADRVSKLVGAVADFRSAPLSTVAARRTLLRVRSSLQKIQKGVEQNNLSKQVMAVELLAGAAALQTVSGHRDIYDPTVETGSFPVGREIKLRSVFTAPTALTSVGPWDISSVSSWVFRTATEAGEVNYTYPAPGAAHRAFLVTKAPAVAFAFPVGFKLYIRFEGEVGPEVIVPLFSGSATSVRDDINAAIGGRGVCMIIGGRLLIFGSALTTKISVHTAGVPQISPTYVPASPSAHAVLNFTSLESSVIGMVTPEDLVTFFVINGFASSKVRADGRVQVSSTGGDFSFLQFANTSGSGLELYFGLSGKFEMKPSGLQLVENGVVLNPTNEGVFVGSQVSVSELDGVRSISVSVSEVRDQTLFFGSTVLPRGTNRCKITAPIVLDTQTMLRLLQPYLGSFEGDLLALQQVLSPLLSRPTPAQVGDALRLLNNIKARLTGLLGVLSALDVRDGRTQYGSKATLVLSALAERNLDYAAELLSAGLFTEFFSLTKEVASKGTRFLKAMEEVGTRNLPITALEENQLDFDGPETDQSSTSEYEGNREEDLFNE